MSISLTANRLEEKGKELLDEVQLDLADVYVRLDMIIGAAEDKPTYKRDVERVKSKGQDVFLYTVTIVTVRRGELIEHVLSSEDGTEIGMVADNVRQRLTRSMAPA